MDLKGKYAVVSVSEALSKFLNKADLTLSSGSIKFNFARFTNLNERGHILANTLLRAIYLYVHINNLFSNDFSIEIFTDDLLNECFNGNVPAKNYYNNNKKIINMDQAVNLQLIPKKINTFEVIKIHNEYFDPSNLVPKNLNCLITLNSIPLKIKFVDDDTIATYIPEDEVKQLIIQNYLVHEIFLTLRNTPTFFKRIDNFNRLRTGLPILKIEEVQGVNLIEFIKIAIGLDKRPVIDELRKDDNINLLYAIIKSDYDLVCNCLKVIDPRWYNNEYYFVALQMNNEKIIDLIRNTIIINTWLENQVFINGFEQLIGITSSYLDITKYMKNNIYV